MSFKVLDRIYHRQSPDALGTIIKVGYDVAASYPPPGVDSVSDVVVDDEGLQITSYYYELVNGEQVLHHITHTVTVDTTTSVEPK